MALQFKFILFQNAREGENSNRDTSKEAESDHKQELDINGGGNYWGPKQGKKDFEQYAADRKITAACPIITRLASPAASLADGVATAITNGLTAWIAAVVQDIAAVIPAFTTGDVASHAAAVALGFVVHWLAIRVVAQVGIPPLWSAHVAKLVPAFASHMVAPWRFLYYIFALRALPVVESVLEKV